MALLILDLAGLLILQYPLMRRAASGIDKYCLLCKIHFFANRIVTKNFKSD